MSPIAAICTAKAAHITRTKDIVELVETWVASHGIRLQYLHSYQNWTRRYKGFGSTMEPFDDGQPRLSWENCVAKKCHQLFEGRIWKCARWPI